MSENFIDDFNFNDIFPILNSNDSNNIDTCLHNNTLGKRSRPKDLDDNSPPLKKKKSSKNDNSDTPNLIVTMPREKLLKSSRTDLDEFVKSVTNGRKLTKEERKEVSRQRKLIKNRNSAAASRKRKKEHQNILESKHSDLLNSQSLIKQRLASLQTENEKLNQEIGFINNLIQSNPFTKSIWDKTQQAKKQFDMASPSLLLVTKYIFVFIMLLNLVFLSSVSNGDGLVQNNTWEAKYSSFENDSQKIIENPLISNTSNSRVPTLVPPPDLPPLLRSNNSSNFENDSSKSEKELEFPMFDDEDKPCEIAPFDETLPDWMQGEFVIPDVVADQYISNLLSNSASVALSTQTHHELKHNYNNIK